MQKRVTLTLLTALALLAGSALAGGEKAQALSLYAGALGGYAASTERVHDVNPYGIGVGASAGIALPVVPIYLGARFVYYFGDSATLIEESVGLKLNQHFLMYGIDLGYDLELGPIVLRPSLGIGRATLENRATTLGTKVSTADSSLYVAPSIGLIVKVALLYVSGELRYNALTDDAPPDSVSLLFGLGVTI